MSAKKGFLYILENPAMPGLVKIGYSDRDPNSRLEELFSTGVPERFVLIYEALIPKAEETEKKVHNALLNFRYKYNREFFSLSSEDAISEVRNILLSERIEILFESGRTSFHSGNFSDLVKVGYLHLLTELKSSKITALDKYQLASDFYTSSADWLSLFYFRQLVTQIYRNGVWYALIREKRWRECTNLVAFFGSFYYKHFESERMPSSLEYMLDNKEYAAAVAEYAKYPSKKSLTEWFECGHEKRIRLLSQVSGWAHSH